MNKLILFFVLMTAFLMVGCVMNLNKENAAAPTGKAVSTSQVSEEHIINIDKLEIYHFHGTNQCYSCKTVGAYAEETVNTYFADELKSGKIVFAHINGELPENRDLVIKYQVTGSSLQLGVYKGNEFQAEENVNVWYKISNKQDYMNYLKGIIEQKLAGN